MFLQWSLANAQLAGRHFIAIAMAQRAELIGEGGKEGERPLRRLSRSPGKVPSQPILMGVTAELSRWTDSGPVAAKIGVSWERLGVREGPVPRKLPNHPDKPGDCLPSR